MTFQEYYKTALFRKVRVVRDCKAYCNYGAAVWKAGDVAHIIGFDSNMGDYPVKVSDGKREGWLQAGDVVVVDAWKKGGEA